MNSPLPSTQKQEPRNPLAGEISPSHPRVRALAELGAHVQERLIAAVTAFVDPARGRPIIRQGPPIGTVSPSWLRARRQLTEFSVYLEQSAEASVPEPLMHVKFRQTGLVFDVEVRPACRPEHFPETLRIAVLRELATVQGEGDVNARWRDRFSLPREMAHLRSRSQAVVGAMPWRQIRFVAILGVGMFGVSKGIEGIEWARDREARALRAVPVTLSRSGNGDAVRSALSAPEVLEDSLAGLALRLESPDRRIQGEGIEALRRIAEPLGEAVGRRPGTESRERFEASIQKALRSLTRAGETETASLLADGGDAYQRARHRHAKSLAINRLNQAARAHQALLTAPGEETKETFRLAVDSLTPGDIAALNVLLGSASPKEVAVAVGFIEGAGLYLTRGRQEFGSDIDLEGNSWSRPPWATVFRISLRKGVVGELPQARTRSLQLISEIESIEAKQRTEDEAAEREAAAKRNDELDRGIQGLKRAADGDVKAPFRTALDNRGLEVFERLNELLGASGAAEREFALDAAESILPRLVYLGAVEKSDGSNTVDVTSQMIARLGEILDGGKVSSGEARRMNALLDRAVQIRVEKGEGWDLSGKAREDNRYQRAFNVHADLELEKLRSVANDGSRDALQGQLFSMSPEKWRRLISLLESKDAEDAQMALSTLAPLLPRLAYLERQEIEMDGTHQDLRSYLAWVLSDYLDGKIPASSRDLASRILDDLASAYVDRGMEWPLAGSKSREDNRFRRAQLVMDERVLDEIVRLGKLGNRVQKIQSLLQYRGAGAGVLLIRELSVDDTEGQRNAIDRVRALRPAIVSTSLLVSPGVDWEDSVLEKLSDLETNGRTAEIKKAAKEIGDQLRKDINEKRQGR